MNVTNDDHWLMYAKDVRLILYFGIISTNDADESLDKVLGPLSGRLVIVGKHLL